MRKIFLVFLFTVYLLSSCKNNTENNNHEINDDTVSTTVNNSQKDIIDIFTPIKGSLYTLGDSIYFDIDLKDNLIPDSINVKIDDKIIISWTEKPFRKYWIEKGLKVGNNIFTVFSYKNGEMISHKSFGIKFKSDIIPKEYNVKIINEYSHNVNDYTQGFIFQDGYIYEGTGQKGHSSIQKYTLKNHEIIQSYSNQNDVFGEGIVIIDNRLIQLTWRSGVGFIYDKESFKRLSKFDFQTEGWGLTYDGNQLIMSDGSNYLYYLETSVFTKTGQFEVYDNLGHIQFLNELEYIDGQIYANIYGKDEIVIIDPNTGKVTGRIFANSVRPEGVPFNTDYALNGIAWDKENKRLFITGKYWPKIFEIELIEK